MLSEAEMYKDDDELARGEMMAKESLRVYMVRTRKALEDIDETKIMSRDRERLETKLDDVEGWLCGGTAKAGKEDFEMKQKELESAMNAIMLRINRAHTDFWEQQVNLPEGEKTIEHGGFYLESGL